MGLECRAQEVQYKILALSSDVAEVGLLGMSSTSAALQSP